VLAARGCAFTLDCVLPAGLLHPRAALPFKVVEVAEVMEGVGLEKTLPRDGLMCRSSKRSQRLI
jgi:hypothetical protein